MENDKSKKGPQEILNELKEYAAKAKAKGLLRPTKEIWNGEPMRKLEIRVGNEFELMRKIESIIRLCVFTLEGEGTYSTSELYKFDSDVPIQQRNSAICTALEFVLPMLPKREMAIYMGILERLSAFESDDKPKENEQE